MRLTKRDALGAAYLNPGAFEPYTPHVIQYQEALERLAKYEDEEERNEKEKR